MVDPNEYGKQIMVALRAVELLHSDTSRLLQDCDKVLGSGESIFKSFATRELTYHVKADHWMAHSVYRFYPARDRKDAAEGVTVCFFDNERGIGNGRISAPCILIGRIIYRDGRDAVEACMEGQGWDLWHAFFGPNNPTVGSVLQRVEQSDSRIQGLDFVALPLYSINSVHDIEKWVEQIRARQSVT